MLLLALDKHVGLLMLGYLQFLSSRAYILVELIGCHFISLQSNSVQENSTNLFPTDPTSKTERSNIRAVKTQSFQSFR